MPKMIQFVWVALASALLSVAQVKPPVGTPAEMTVTVGHSFGGNPPVLTPNDLTVTQDYEPVVITNLIPLRGDRADLELFVIVDNCSNCDPGSKFEEIRRFIVAQPPTTEVGVASIDGGRLKVIEHPTADHARAIKALGVPTGSKPSSPFDAVTELIRSWPRGNSQRAVLLISNGIDPVATDMLQSRSAETALETAQRAGVTFYAIYHPSADYFTSDGSKMYSGQVQLAHLANETGGEAYFVSFGPLPSLTPLLADLSDHLANRYLVQFLAKPVEGPGELEDVSVKSKIPDVDLMAPVKVWIRGRVSGPSDSGNLPPAQRP